MTSSSIQRVLLGQDLVGYLELSGDRTTFRFADEYLALEVRPVLGRWFEDHLSASFEAVGIHSRVPTFFENYLPETGTLLRRLIAKDAGVAEHREFALLARLGDDLPGDIRVEGPTLAGADHDAPVGTDRSPSDTLRFSLAGVQLKFSVARANDRFTLPATGCGGKWILKLPDPMNPALPSAEYAMLRWAREVGITTPECTLVHRDEVHEFPTNYWAHEDLALAVRRFDRGEDETRTHQEDFAQVLGTAPEEKYERGNYATLARIILVTCGEADYAEFLRRLVFVVISGNADAHLKNWSFIYPDRQNPRLSPAYDLVCTVAYPRYDKALALKLAGERRIERVTRGHFSRLAQRVGADVDFSMSIVDDAVRRMSEVWSSGAVEGAVARELRPHLREHVETTLRQLR